MHKPFQGEMMMNEDTLLEVKGLVKHFPITGGLLKRVQNSVKAVDGVNLTIFRGETLGLVGESGCGKTTLGRTIAMLQRPDEGQILFEGQNILDYPPRKLRGLRKEIQTIFQDPYSSLNPRQTVGNIIGEPFEIHHIGTRLEREKKVDHLMEVVGLRSEQFHLYPHEFSGGQRQRISIARALALNPKLIICDEPISALDVSIKAQVINLLEDLQKEFNLTYLFITHDLAVVEHVSDRVAVMYLGRLVELANSADIHRIPYHPYTEALLSASPVPDPTATTDEIVLKGDVPSPINPPQGCRFHTRCPFVIDKCRQEPGPPWEELTQDHWVCCWRAGERHHC